MSDDPPQQPPRPYGHPEDQPEPGAPQWQGYRPPPAPDFGPPPPGYGPPGYGQPYGGPPYGQPHGGPPYGLTYSDKTKTTAGLLQLLLPFVGICGVGRLYAGHVGIGVTQLVGVLVSFCLSAIVVGIPFLVGFWLWSVIDGILMLTGEPRDAQGRVLRPS